MKGHQEEGKIGLDTRQWNICQVLSVHGHFSGLICAWLVSEKLSFFGFFRNEDITSAIYIFPENINCKEF